jgi:trehalose-phosphatase
VTSVPSTRERDLDSALTDVATSDQILIACDYDGTLAELVDDPSEARPRQDAMSALRALALLDHTSVGIVSGRPLRELAAMTRLPQEIVLVGSHGVEFDLDFRDGLDDATKATLSSLVHTIDAMVEAAPGVLVERKPSSVSLHFRLVTPLVTASLVDAVMAGPAQWPGVYVRQGKSLLELSVVHADKGTAITRLTTQTLADVVLFVGDDLTDEDAFVTLTAPNVSVKVGVGDSAAQYRVDDPAGVAAMLATVLERRAGWLSGP